MSAEPDRDDGLPKDAPNRLGRWLASQVNNLDLTRREAAQHLVSRWDVTFPKFRLTRPIRALRSEESPYLTGVLLLAQDYRDLFGEDTLREIGPVGIVEFDVITCTECSREAVPGSDRCGRHGGQFLTPEDARKVSEHTFARVLSATDKAVRVLEDLLDNGRSEMVRLQAANSILDRAGITSATRVELEVTSGASVAELLSERLEQVRESMTKVEEIESRPATTDEEGAAVTAEVED